LRKRVDVGLEQLVLSSALVQNRDRSFLQSVLQGPNVDHSLQPPSVTNKER